MTIRGFGLTGLLRFVLKMPDELVFKRILPATGLMMCMSTMYYAWLAYKLAKKTGRTDVCALPSGISVPHMFIVTLVIMLPIKGVSTWSWLWQRQHNPHSGPPPWRESLYPRQLSV